MRRTDLGEFLDGDHEADRVEPGAADLFGPGYAEQSELSHLFDVLPRKRRRLVML